MRVRPRPHLRFLHAVHPVGHGVSVLHGSVAYAGAGEPGFGEGVAGGRIGGVEHGLQTVQAGGGERELDDVLGGFGGVAVAPGVHTEDVAEGGQDRVSSTQGEAADQLAFDCDSPCLLLARLLGRPREGRTDLVLRLAEREGPSCGVADRRTAVDALEGRGVVGGHLSRGHHGADSFALLCRRPVHGGCGPVGGDGIFEGG